jgi:transposase-like protein
VITVTVRWYLRYGLSYRDVEELPAERGIDVDHVMARRFRWTRAFCPFLCPPGGAARAARLSADPM